MYLQTRNTMPEKIEEFNKPVESIMRCEDFKSNFARRLSNRYTSRSSGPPELKKDTGLKLRPADNDIGNVSDNALERIEQSTQLSKNTNMEQNGEPVKPPDKPPMLNSDVKRTEVTVLNMEVETLRWQLAQTEANRQMHIALLKQIIAFLNRVKDHIEHQSNETYQKDTLPSRLLPKSFNMADLPRSRSVVHVNKNLEFPLATPKKICTRKISKSISNMNGFKDYNGMWSQSKLSLEPKTETSQKISEEMSRLITLANTVLSTKIPDLSCSYIDTEPNLIKQPDLNTIDNDFVKSDQNSVPLSQIKEDASNVCKENVDQFVDVKEKYCIDFNLSLSSLCGLELKKDLTEIKPNKENRINIAIENGSDLIVDAHTKSRAEKGKDFNTSFIEDESGFSSMSSFQEIGIPIISVIPPSPSKEIGFLEEIPNLVDDVEKWKTDPIELEKQTMKVFWV